jgi:protease IV
MYLQKDSVFFSALRSFFKAFSAVVGLGIGLIFLVIATAPFSENIIVPGHSEAIVAIDANGGRTLLSSSVPVVLRINFNGEIGLGDLTHEKIQTMLLDSREGTFSNNRVKAVLLYINSPGGMADDSDAIYRLLMEYKQKYKVPIYAYADGLCASGGVYIASAADRIFASPSTVYGSVGARMGPMFNFSQVMDKIGVQSLTLTNGKDKDMLNPFRAWKPGEEECLVNINSELYNQFVDIVVKARPALSKEKLVNEYGAQVYMASVAQTYGYIDDGQSSYAQALTELTKAANISEPYQVFELEVPHSYLEGFGIASSALLKGKVTHTVEMGPHFRPEFCGKFLYHYQPF